MTVIWPPTGGLTLRPATRQQFAVVPAALGLGGTGASLPRRQLPADKGLDLVAGEMFNRIANAEKHASGGPGQLGDLWQLDRNGM
jgi:hypothetical protein